MQTRNWWMVGGSGGRSVVLGVLLGFTGTVPASAQQVVDPAGHVLSGEVVDSQGGSMPGVSVRVRSGMFERSVVTDTSGRFSVAELPAGDYRLDARIDGFAPYEESVQVPGSDDLRIELRLAHFMQEVVVTAILPEITVEREITARELEEHAAQDVAEFLREEPGLSATRRGPINLEPTIRGLQETQVGMFVDGTRTFAAGPARMDSDLSHVSPHTIDSIRVIKGPYALTWGSGTLSAIRLDTFRPSFTTGDFQAHGRVGVNYGANGDAADGHASLWGSDDRFRFAVFHNTRVGSDYEDGEGRRIPGDYRSYDTRWGLGWQADERGLLEYSGGYQEQRDVDYAGRILDATFFETQSHMVEFTRSGDGGAVDELYGQLYANLKDHLMNNDEKPTAFPMPGRIPPFGLRVDLPAESNTIGGRGHALVSRGRVRWKLGFDFYRLNQSATRTIARRDNDRVLFEDIVWPDATISSLGGYGQMIYTLGTAEIGGTVRLDRVDASAGEVSDFFLETTTGDLDQTEGHVSAALSLHVPIDDAWSVNGGVGRAVRTAAALERYSDRFPGTKFQVAAEFMGNPSLQPEQSLEFNFGVAGRHPQTTVEANVFYRTIDDYITVVPDPSIPKRLPLSPDTVYRYVNGTEARFRGYELRGTQEIGDYAEANANISYVWAQDAFLDEPVFGIAPLEQRYGVQLHTPPRHRWVRLDITTVGDQERVATTRLEVPTEGWTVVDVRAGIELLPDWVLRLGVENLGDAHYATHLNSLNPFTRERIAERGRSTYVGLGWVF